MGFRISDRFWERIQALLAPAPPRPGGGCPAQPDRRMMDAIFYLLRTGAQWNALPRCLSASSTVHDRFQKWQRQGLFSDLWRAGLLEFGRRVGMDWRWQSMDGALVKAPLGGKIYRSQSHRLSQERHQAQRADREARAARGPSSSAFGLRMHLLQSGLGFRIGSNQPDQLAPTSKARP